MVEKWPGMRWMLGVTFSFWFVQPASPDSITLKDGSVFEMDVARYDGRNRRLTVANGGRSVEIRTSEVESIDFDDGFDILTLRDGSVYTNAIHAIAFDGRDNSFKIRRGGLVNDIRASEITAIDFDTANVDGSGVVAIPPVVPLPGVAVNLPPLPPVETVSEEPTVSEEADTSEPSVAEDARTGVESEVKTLEENWDLPEKISPLDHPAAAEGWSDDELYSNLPSNIRKILEPESQAQQGGEGGRQPYVARWKGQGASKAIDAKGSKSTASRPSTPAKTASASSHKSSASRGKSRSAPPSDRNMAKADDSQRTNRSSRSSSRSNRGGDYGQQSYNGSNRSNSGGSGRFNSRGSSRFGDDSYGGGYGNSGNYGGGGSGGYGSSNGSNYGSNRNLSGGGGRYR